MYPGKALTVVSEELLQEDPAHDVLPRQAPSRINQLLYQLGREKEWPENV